MIKTRPLTPKSMPISAGSREAKWPRTGMETSSTTSSKDILGLSIEKYRIRGI